MSQKSNAFFFSIEIITDIGTCIIYQNEAGPLWITSLPLNIVIISLNSKVPPSNERMYPCLLKLCSLFFLVDFLPRGETISPEAYIEILTRPRARIQQGRPNLLIDNIFLLYANAYMYTDIRTKETTASFGLTTLPQPPYSPDLALSDNHLFGSMKKGLKAKHYVGDDEVRTAVMKWFLEQWTEFGGVLKLGRLPPVKMMLFRTISSCGSDFEAL